MTKNLGVLSNIKKDCRFQAFRYLKDIKPLTSTIKGSITRTHGLCCYAGSEYPQNHDSCTLIVVPNSTVHGRSTQTLTS